MNLPQQLGGEERSIKGIIREKEIKISSTQEGIPGGEEEEEEGGGDAVKCLKEPMSEALKVNKHIGNHQMVSYGKDEIHIESMVNSTPCFSKEKQVFKSKGEDLFDQESQNLALSISCGFVGESELACIPSELLSNSMSFKDEELERVMVYSDVDRQCIVEFLIYVDEDLEMGDSSTPSFQVYDDLEMGNSSSLVTFSSFSCDVTKSLEALSKDFSKFDVKNCLDFKWHAIISLWLFLIEGCVLRFGNWFHKTVNVHTSNLPLLQAHEGK